MPPQLRQKHGQPNHPPGRNLQPQPHLHGVGGEQGGCVRHGDVFVQRVLDGALRDLEPLALAPLHPRLLQILGLGHHVAAGRTNEGPGVSTTGWAYRVGCTIAAQQDKRVQDVPVTTASPPPYSSPQLTTCRLGPGTRAPTAARSERHREASRRSGGWLVWTL